MEIRLNKSRVALGCILIFLASSHISVAQKSKQKNIVPKPAILWDNWYTVQTVSPPLPFAYYHEKVMRTEGKIIYQSHLWKKEGHDINEEHMGAFALDDEFLTPFSYNYYSRFGLHETKVDGSVDNRHAKIRVTAGGKELPIVKKFLPKKTFFASFFPLYLAKVAHELKPKSRKTFRALMEDGIQDSFRIKTGQVSFGKPDNATQKTKTIKLDVNFDRMRSSWYILSSGEPVGIAMISQGLVIKKVTEAKAKVFFQEKLPKKEE